MKIKLTLLLLLLFSSKLLLAQDEAFARKIVDTLSSRHFWGRGYTKHGVHKAEKYLAAQFKTIGLKPMDGKSFLQPFSYSVNTYPGKMNVAINGEPLIPGQDFIVSPESQGIKKAMQLEEQDSTHFVNVADRVMVVKENKLTWSAEQKAKDYIVIEVNKSLFKSKPASISINIKSKLIAKFKTANICGIVKGTSKPDSVIVYTAHYDHLGGMGRKTFFPGANDNASGVAQVLSLAKYYAAHPQPYTMAFILFSGEEIGLLGSKYFTEHPLIPLKSIRFLVNLDLEGTGIDGITVVNATIYPKEFNMLKQINNKDGLLAKVNSRGEAANSDHYFFSKNNVPAFYIYTLGGIKAYHDIYDISATLPMNKYNDIFTLLLKFNNALMNKQQ
ncbi:M28 family metallopeptidase [Mucilaginibacter sp. L196]|uniref:M28 family metallopeptidase n=1 Tax=Mucilaginibacter sp. L196 TaxID=1641870 RepID=UPI00131C324C|nr:M28 family peptidase [Mucilaginibacter sp. L196]